MARITQPEIKQELLKRCFQIVLDCHSFDVGINEIGKAIGSSGRMLVYHFGSKQNVRDALINQAENELRMEFEALSFDLQKTHVLLRFWDCITTNKKLTDLLALVYHLSIESLRKKDLKNLAEQESDRWLELVLPHEQNAEFAKALVLLFQGALLDYLVTGDAVKGRKALEAVLERKQTQ